MIKKTEHILKRTAIILIAAIMLFAFCLPSFALPINGQMGDTYFYNQNGIAVACPVAYRTVNIKGYKDLGAGSGFMPIDMFTKGDYLYVLDQTGNQILVLDSEYTTVKIINQIKDTKSYSVPDLNYYIYNADGTREEDASLKRADKYAFNAPSGIFVTDDEQIYIADTENRRIVVCDFDGNCIQVYQNPSVNALGIEYIFKPQKIVVDNTGTISVIAYGVNKGLMQFDSNGKFTQFFAAPKVAVSVTDWLTSLFKSKEERAKIRDVAAEYVSVAMDSRGFIYTTATKGTAALRKISTDGADVLDQTDARFTTVGDVSTTPDTTPQIVDVAINDETSTYTVLDARMGRFFTYSSTGMLLYMGGGSGNQFGRFKAPNVIECRGNQVIVADAGNKTITVYETTDYALAVHEGFSAMRSGQYNVAQEKFEQVIQYNSNMYVANEFLGDIQKMYGSQALDDDPMRLEYYKKALDYYKLSETKSGYSDCYEILRNAEMQKYFILIFTSFIILLVGIIVLIYVRKYRKNRAEEQRRLDLQ